MDTAALIDRISKDPDLSEADKLHLLSQVDPDFPKASQSNLARPAGPAMSTEQSPAQSPAATPQPVGADNIFGTAARGMVRGVEKMVSPGLALSEWVGNKLGILPPLKPGETPESEAVVGAISDYFKKPQTTTGRILERTTEELGAGGPFLGAARKAGALRKTIADYLAMGAGAGTAHEVTPSFVNDLPGGELGSEVLGQLGGLSLRRGGSAAIGGIAHTFPSVREGKAHSAFLERIGGLVGDRDKALASLQEAQALKQQFPGFNPTLGQATGDPGLMAIEHQARNIPGIEAAIQGRTEQSKRALARGVAGAEEQAPAVPAKLTESVVKQQQTFEQKAAALTAQAQDSLRSIEARYAQQLQNMPPIAREQAGKEIFDEVMAKHQQWREDVKTLYNTGPAASAKKKPVDLKVLLEQLDTMKQKVDPAELPSSFPDELVSHIKRLQYDKNGDVRPVTLESLRTLRSVVGQAERVAKAELAPDPKLLGRIQAIQGAVEDQFDLALASPVFTVAEVAALQKANDAYRQGAQMFRQDPIAKLFRGGVHGEETRMPMSGVSGMFLHGGKGSVEDARALVEAVGPTKGMDLLRKDALSQLANLRDSTGAIPPARFETWLRQNREVLAAYPALQQEFGALRKAQLTLDSSKEAVKALPNAIKPPEVLESDAAKLYLNQPTRLAVKGMLDKPNAPELLSQTLALTKGDSVAQMGLRRAVWQELTGRMGLMAPPGTIWNEHSASVAEVVQKNRAVLSRLYTPGQLQTLEQSAKAENILARMPAEQRVKLENIFQHSAVGKFAGPFFSRLFAIASGRTSEQFVLAESASRRVISVLEGLDETKQRAIIEHTLLSPDLLNTFTNLMKHAGGVPQAKVKVRQFLYTLGLESRSPDSQQAQSAVAE